MAVESVLYQKITDDLRKAIDGGIYKPGDKIPSVSELRETYAVSHITVMRAYKELCSLDYIYARRSCGYFVKERVAIPTLTGRIGNFVRPLWSYNARDNYFNAINAGIQQEAYRLHFDLIGHHAMQLAGALPIRPGGQQEMVDAMLALASEVDGFIVDERIDDAMIAPVLEKLGKPLVFVNRPTELAAGAVRPPNYDGMTELFRFALRQEYGCWVFCELNMATGNELERSRAFEDFTSANGIATTRIHGSTLNPWEETRQAIDAVLAERGAERLLFVTPSNYSGREFAAYLERRGLRFGRDVGLVSFESLDLAASERPSLFTVGYQPEDIGAQAVALLREMLSYPASRGTSINRTVGFTIVPGETL